jgi:hypothetical protein
VKSSQVAHTAMNTLPEKPFFIVGHPRSGTTLLRFILSSHPRIFIPEETGFIPFLPHARQFTIPFDGFVQILERIGSLNYLWKDLVASPRDFYNSLPQKNLAFILDGLYRIHIAPYGRVRWGDKTPLYVQYLRSIDAIFPQAQFIHLIRDGRDTLLSARKKWPDRRYYRNDVYLINNWIRNVNAGRKAALWLGTNRYLEIRYEDLVTSPRATTKEICAFLGETFYEAMLDHTQLAHQVGPGPDDHREILHPISQNSISRWKAELSLSEKKMFQHAAGDLLRRLGYEIETLPPMTVSESFRCLVSHVEFFFLDSIRTMLYKTGLLTLNRKMRNDNSS